MIGLQENYDVVVVGVGPAGSMAARTIAQAGNSVLLFSIDLVHKAPPA